MQRWVAYFIVKATVSLIVTVAWVWMFVQQVAVPIEFTTAAMLILGYLFADVTNGAKKQQEIKGVSNGRQV